jgi:hypothetical protein
MLKRDSEIEVLTCSINFPSNIILDLKGTARNIYTRVSQMKTVKLR